MDPWAIQADRLRGDRAARHDRARTVGEAAVSSRRVRNLSHGRCGRLQSAALRDRRWTLTVRESETVTAADRPPGGLSAPSAIVRAPGACRPPHQPRQRPPMRPDQPIGVDMKRFVEKAAKMGLVVPVLLEEGARSTTGSGGRGRDFIATRPPSSQLLRAPTAPFVCGFASQFLKRKSCGRRLGTQTRLDPPIMGRFRSSFIDTRRRLPNSKEMPTGSCAFPHQESTGTHPASLS